MSMKIGLIDIGFKMENCALMKISAREKNNGNKTQLIKGKLGLWEYENFDRLYASCVFTKNRAYAEYLASKGVIVGGYGYNGIQLPSETEHIMPDYDLYGFDRSIGRKTIGCNRNCEWCIVPKVEGRIKDHAPIKEFHHPSHNKLILLDDNILMLPNAFREAIEYITSNGLKVCFTQGLDIRLINEENAGVLANCDYRSLRFNERRLYFAFDDPQIEPEVRQGVERLKKAGVRAREQMFYFLCGFREPYNFAEDWHRFKVLVELGVDPYVMKYNGRRDIRILNHFSRYVNRRSYKYGEQRARKYVGPREWQELQAAISSVEEAS